MSAEPLLEVTEVTVRFGGQLALDRVSLTAAAGEVTGIIGPNGAGKTTLFNVVCGLQKGEGTVRLAGGDITSLQPFQRARRGMARTFQRLELFGVLSVRGNVRVAADVRGSYDRSEGRPRRRSELDTAADSVLARLGLEDVADRRADELPTGLARLVEVGRALATKPRLLLLDEPASGQSATETAAFASLLRSLAADGMGVVLVEHDVHLVMDVCDLVHVLDFGRVIASGRPDEVRDDPAVQAAYLGAPEAVL